MKFLITESKRLLKSQNQEKGFLLLTSLMLISTMSIFSLALFSRSHIFTQTAERNQNRVIAFNLAESAVDIAIAAIQEDNSYEGVDYTSLSADGFQGGYEVQVSTPDENPDVRLITATGYAPSNNASDRAYESRTTLAYIEIGTSSAFEFAVFSDEGMLINGNPEIDSYDSRDGAYDPATAGSNGDIGTNATDEGSISLTGNAVVNGDAASGPESDPDDAIDVGTNASITGTTSALDVEKSFSLATTPGDATDLGAVSIAGKTVYSLPAGTYYMDSLSITGQASLSASGPVTIYLGGQLRIAGNGVSTSDNEPPNMLFFMTTDDDVSISGNGDLYAGIYAPESDVRNTGNGEVYGAIVANDYQQSGNGDMHYDEALNEVASSGGGEISLKAWSESNTLMA